MPQKFYHAIESLLAVLMAHVLKWIEQPEKRSSSWVKTINDTRMQIKKQQAQKPSANDNFIRSVWEKIFGRGKRIAEDEMKKKAKTDELTWKQVFDDDYEV